MKAHLHLLDTLDGGEDQRDVGQVQVLEAPPPQRAELGGRSIEVPCIPTPSAWVHDVFEEFLQRTPSAWLAGERSRMRH